MTLMLEFAERDGWDRLIKDAGHEWWQFELKMHGEVYVIYTAYM